MKKLICKIIQFFTCGKCCLNWCGDKCDLKK